ncbi:MAG: hypothetical protein CNLJKLNK_01209 [Holosporales bacterium]
MNVKETPSDLAKHDLTQNDNLPDWFCLIQTNRKYYIERYRDLQQGKNKMNYAAFFSLICSMPFQLLYRKFFIKPMLILLATAVSSFSLLFLAPFIFLDGLGTFFPGIFSLAVLYIFFIFLFYILPAFFVSRKYNVWYFKSVRKKYEAGYCSSFYKDTFPSAQYLFVGYIFGFIMLLLTYIDFSHEPESSLISNTLTVVGSLPFIIRLFVFIDDRKKLKQNLENVKNKAD